MPRWTPEQEQVLYDHGNEGPEACARLIWRRFGVLRTATATERHANRICAPMIVYSGCPQCGRPVRKLNRQTGLCPQCSAAMHAEYWREVRDQLERGCAADDNARRAYERERKAAMRARERRYGDFVDLSEKMSVPSSGLQKKFA